MSGYEAAPHQLGQRVRGIPQQADGERLTLRLASAAQARASSSELLSVQIAGLETAPDAFGVHLDAEPTPPSW